ncbi:MAG: cupin domain-containing protein [Faecousia sp.]
MIRKNGSYRLDVREQMMGGEGRFLVENILEPDEMHGKGRLFAKGTLARGHSVGYHVHTKDMEVCYFLSGSGVVTDEHGIKTEVHAGDCNIVFPGQGHEIVNTGKDDLTYIALILFTEN